MTHDKSFYTLQSVHKAFGVLELLADSKDDVSAQNLAERADISRSKMLRLLSTLCENGLVEQINPSGNYRLGIKSFSFAQKLVKCSNVINIAHPVITQLALKHDEAVYMAVIKGDDVLFVDMVDCDQQIKAVPLIGKTYPFFTNAAGKVMKCLDSCDTLLRKKGRPKEGAPTPEQLNNELSEIRKKGVAIDKGGLGDGIISVAVAIKDYSGKVIGAITMIGPSFRMLADRIENEIIPSLVEEADLLSNKFGYVKAYA